MRNQISLAVVASFLMPFVVHAQSTGQSDPATVAVFCTGLTQIDSRQPFDLTCHLHATDDLLALGGSNEPSKKEINALQASSGAKDEECDTMEQGMCLD